MRFSIVCNCALIKFVSSGERRNRYEHNFKEIEREREEMKRERGKRGDNEKVSKKREQITREREEKGRKIEREREK